MAKLATFNLFHYAVPGIFWHEREPTATYTDAQWTAKNAWIGATLDQMGADVVGFQEVVSVEALRNLAATHGYPHFYAAGHPIFDATDPAIYVNAVVALASKHPMLVSDLNELGGIPADTVIDDQFRFSRTPVIAKVAFPDIGETTVYVCHFKSQGAFVLNEDIDAIADWGDKIRTYFRLRAIAGVDQVSKRAAEAGVLYQLFRRALEQDPKARVVLLGDLNEGPESHTIGILTQSERVFSWGSQPPNAIPADKVFLKHTYPIYDSWSLAATPGGQRPFTHRSGVGGSVLDYVILTNAFNPRNPGRSATVESVKVFDAHFVNEVPKQQSSDHAPVVANVIPI